MRKLLTVLATLAMLSLTNCGYNAIQSNDEQVKSAWSEVLNQYQRRADLVPNLVNSVKGFAQQEKDVLLGVTNARAKVGSIQATPELVNDPGHRQVPDAAPTPPASCGAGRGRARWRWSGRSAPGCSSRPRSRRGGSGRSCSWGSPR